METKLAKHPARTAPVTESISAYNPTLIQKIEDALGISLSQLGQGAKSAFTDNVDVERAYTPQGKAARTAVDVGGLFTGAGKTIVGTGAKLAKTAKAKDLSRLGNVFKGFKSPVSEATIKETKHLADLNKTLPNVRPATPGLDLRQLKMPNISNKTPGIIGLRDSGELVEDVKNELGQAQGIPRYRPNPLVSAEANSRALVEGQEVAETPAAQPTERFGEMPMPQGNTSFSENLPALPEYTQEPLPAGANDSQIINQLLEMYGQTKEPTPAAPVVDTAKVAENFYERNPANRPAAAPQSKLGAVVYWLKDQFNALPQQRPIGAAEQAKLMAEMGISAEGQTGEQGLNRQMRGNEHLNALSGQVNEKDIFGLGTDLTKMNKGAQIQSRHAQETSRLNEGSQTRLMEKQNELNNSQQNVNNQLMIRNLAQVGREAAERMTGIKFSDAAWNAVVTMNSPKQEVDPMKQMMAMILMEKLGGRMQGGQQPQNVNLKALQQ